MAIDAELAAGMITETRGQKPDAYHRTARSRLLRSHGRSQQIRPRRRHRRHNHHHRQHHRRIFRRQFSRGEQIMDVLTRYTLLTIGEGLVSQMPALLISTATGLLVTRSDLRQTNLGAEFSAQLFSTPTPPLHRHRLPPLPLLVLPGFPKIQLSILAASCCRHGSLTFSLSRTQKNAPPSKVARRLAGKTDEPRATSHGSRNSVIDLLGATKPSKSS